MVASCDAVCKDNQFACADGKQVLQNRIYICNHDNLMFPLIEQNNNNLENNFFWDPSTCQLSIG